MRYVGSDNASFRRFRSEFDGWARGRLGPDDAPPGEFDSLADRILSVLLTTHDATSAAAAAVHELSERWGFEPGEWLLRALDDWLREV